jgi:Domain of unknown function (DUF4190)
MSDGPGDEQRPPEWQQPQWQQPQPPQWQQPQWGQQPYYYQPGPRTPGSATAALILGICALMVCAPICGPLAIIYGNKAHKEIDGSNGQLTGRGLGTAGLVMGWIGTALTVLVVVGIVIAVILDNSG